MPLQQLRTDIAIHNDVYEKAQGEVNRRRWIFLVTVFRYSCTGVN